MAHLKRPRNLEAMLKTHSLRNLNIRFVFDLVAHRFRCHGSANRPSPMAPRPALVVRCLFIYSIALSLGDNAPISGESCATIMPITLALSLLCINSNSCATVPFRGRCNLDRVLLLGFYGCVSCDMNSNENLQFALSVSR